MVRLRVRIRFTKQGDLRLIGHRDLMRCFERIFRRAGLALSFSEGFHPKPRMTFPSALAVGIEGLDEVMEVELAKAGKGDSPHLCDDRRFASVSAGGPFRRAPTEGWSGTVPFSGAEELLRRLTPCAPPGLEFLAAEALPEGSRKARVQSVRYEVRLASPPPADLPGRIQRLLSASSWPVVRPHRRSPIDLRPPILELALTRDGLAMRLEVARSGGVAGPRDVLAALELADLERFGARLRRTAVEVCA